MGTQWHGHGDLGRRDIPAAMVARAVATKSMAFCTSAMLTERLALLSSRAICSPRSSMVPAVPSMVPSMGDCREPGRNDVDERK